MPILKPTMYEYKGKIYCEEDLSYENDDYAGDLYDLYWELKQDDKCGEETIYYTQSYAENKYSSAEELIEEEFSHLKVVESEDITQCGRKE